MTGTVVILADPQSPRRNMNLSINRYNQVYAEFSAPSAIPL